MIATHEASRRKVQRHLKRAATELGATHLTGDLSVLTLVHLTLLVPQQQRVVCSIVHGVVFHNSSMWFAALCVGMCIRLSNLTMDQHQCIYERHLIWNPVKL